MNNFYHLKYNQLLNEYQLLKQLTHYYQQKTITLKQDFEELENKQDKLDEYLDKPLSENKIPASVSFTINTIKINQIQSGAAFNLGERITNYTNSDMEMNTGPNSMNIGDHNQMKHCVDDKIKVKLAPPSMEEEV